MNREEITELEKRNIELIDERDRQNALERSNLRKEYIRSSFPAGVARVVRHYANMAKIKRFNKSRINREYASPLPVADKKGVVYTCVFDGYDELRDPLVNSTELRFVAFTDAVRNSETGCWEIEDYPALADPRININRWCKMHPFELFEGCDYAIYIDGNVTVTSDVSSLYRVAKEAPCGIAMHAHHLRECVYDEAAVCRITKKGNAEAISGQMARYRSEGFPRKFGLCEATVIVTDLKNPSARELYSAWWDEFCRSESGRDQLALPYVMWKLGYSMSDIGCLGNDEYHNPKFFIEQHKGVKSGPFI